MTGSRVVRSVAFALVLLVSAGCDLVRLDPLPPGGRAWTIMVVNRSPRPATLVVAIDGPQGAGRAVGTANPDVVPPGTTAHVTFGLPPGDDWAIFVNPGPDMGPLLMPIDISGADRIEIDASGGPSWVGGS